MPDHSAAPLDLPSATPPARRRVVAAWARTPAGGLTLLILATSAARLAFAASLGLGIDESYMVAAGRTLQLSYFDHPPIAWWLAWGAAHIAGNDRAIVVRLPFIALFALSTMLMYRVTASLFGERAGLWAAAMLNTAPVLGVTSATWVLPDGPLIAALLGGVACLVRALPSQRKAAWGWWSATGACAGLALSSKYSAALTIAGALSFLLTEPTSRRWLSRPQPYVAGILALMVFLPALIWNARHGWVSFLFQGGRAGGHFYPFGPLAAIGGAALYFLPWIWLPLVLCGFDALRRGPADRDRWLLVCLAAPRSSSSPWSAYRAGCCSTGRRRVTLCWCRCSATRLPAGGRPVGARECRRSQPDCSFFSARPSSRLKYGLIGWPRRRRVSSRATIPPWPS